MVRVEGRRVGGAAAAPAAARLAWVDNLKVAVIAGIITERDVVRAVADRRDLADCTAGEYMTSAPVTVELETPLRDVARTMLAYGVRHLPVVVAGEVIGMVSARDPLDLQSATTV